MAALFSRRFPQQECWTNQSPWAETSQSAQPVSLPIFLSPGELSVGAGGDFVG
jgi:hypothetical protein